MQINKAYKFKLKLTKTQEVLVNNWISTCRYLYNVAKEVREVHYQKYGKTLHRYELAKQITEVRAEFDWVKSVPVHTCQEVTERLDVAYKKFFDGGGYPKWAKKGRYLSLIHI